MGRFWTASVASARTASGSRQLGRLRPGYLSVTYGAAGSGQERSLRLVERLAGKKEFTFGTALTIGPR